VIEGGSNGGLLMGSADAEAGFVWAVVSHVGIYDALRTELEPMGNLM